MKNPKPCEACHAYCQTDTAHIKSKGAGGKDGPDDVMELCRLCHRTQHSLGWFGFIGIHPHLDDVLKAKGWHVEDVFGIKKIRRR